jgi:hypothetical protein
MNQITSVCSVCGVHLRGPWPARNGLSHGLCDQHYRQAIREVGEWLHRPEQTPRRETPVAAT